MRHGLTLPQLRRQVTGRQHNGSFSLRFSKLTLNFLRARADDKESAIWELSRHSANEIGIGGMEGDSDTGTLYWLKPATGKSTLPRRSAIPLVLQCSISLSIFSTARD
jgi:hypothetical protein